MDEQFSVRLKLVEMIGRIWTTGWWGLRTTSEGPEAEDWVRGSATC
jgi:hypothetical protein